MKKYILLVVLCIGLLISGGIAAYEYLGEQEPSDYSSGMFVDRGDLDGYAAMYHLFETI